MFNTIWGIVRQGKVDLLDSVELSEGQKVLVTLLSDEEARFWLQASQKSLDGVWDNSEDDIYAQLLEE